MKYYGLEAGENGIDIIGTCADCDWRGGFTIDPRDPEHAPLLAEATRHLALKLVEIDAALATHKSATCRGKTGGS